MKKLFFIVLMFFVPSFAYSDQQDIDKVELQCVNNTSARSEMIVCAQSAQEAWEDEIKTCLKLLKKVLSREDYKNLIASQAEWEDYKNEEFKMVDTIFIKHQDYKILSANFKREIIKQRAIYLRAYYNSSKKLINYILPEHHLISFS